MGQVPRASLKKEDWFTSFYMMCLSLSQVQAIVEAQYFKVL